MTMIWEVREVTITIELNSREMVGAQTSSTKYGQNKYGQTLFYDQGVDILSNPIHNVTKAYIGNEYYKNKI